VPERYGLRHESVRPDRRSLQQRGHSPEWQLLDCTEDDWQRTLDVNLKSMYLLCREAIPLMRKQGSGCVINMSSIAGTNGIPNRGAYSVSKAGVIGSGP